MDPWMQNMEPAMLGILAGQQLDQQRALDRQNALVAEQTWWLKWQDPAFQRSTFHWMMNADIGDVAAWWIDQCAALGDGDRCRYMCTVIDGYLDDLDADERDPWLEDFNEAVELVQQIRSNNSNNRKKKRWWQ